MFEKLGIGQIAVAAVLVLAGAGGALGVMAYLDRTPETEPGERMVLGGPAIPGLCILDHKAVFNTSKIGVSANTQYKALRDAAQSGVSAKERVLVAEAKALTSQKSALPDAQYQSRRQDLAKRMQALRQEAEQDSQELESTRKDAVTRIAKAAQPVIASVYRKNGCGVLLSREGVLEGNPAMDITEAVIAGLDARMTTIQLNRKQAPAKP